MTPYTVPPQSWLFYGGDASGKSYMLASTIKDMVTGEVLRRGCILDGEEKLGHLELPEDTLFSIRPGLQTPKKILDSVRSWVSKYRQTVSSSGGERLDVIGMDSLTEYQFLYRLALGREASDKNANEDPEVLSTRSWGKIYDRLALDLGYLKPQKLGAHFIATAGMMKLDDTDTYRYDALVEDGRVQPALQGQLRRNIGRIFDMVVYVEKVWPDRKGGQIQGELIHRYHFAKNGDFKIRNGQEHRRTLPPYLDGTATSPLQFDNILQILEG